MRPLLTAAFFAVLLALPAATAEPPEPITGTLLPLAPPGGWAITADGTTLVVSQPEKGELVYFDTVAEREVKRVTVDFKPGPMALQGDALYVGAKGASVVHVLDAKTGKPRKEIELGGEAVAHLACHPTKGPVYASSATYQVFSIDPATVKGTKTKAVGYFLAVDPTDGGTLFTGVQPPLDETEVFVQDLPGGKIRVFVDTWGRRAFVLKYTADVKGGLKLASAQPNAAVNAYSLAVTPDGKKVMMTSGGGWRPPAGGGTGGGYVCAAFNTDRLESRVGEAPSGTNMAFHPVLNLGVLNQNGRVLQLFNPKSLVAGKAFEVAKGADARPLLVTFAAKGTKIVLWNGDNPQNPLEGLHFLPLALTAADRAALEKAYGKLPPAAPPKAPAVAVAPKSQGTPKGPRPPVTPKTPTPTPPPTPEPPAPKTPPEPAAPLPPGVIAETGFNGSKGINASDTNPPYPLGKSNTRGGAGERGWRGVWPASERATFVKEPVAEGDGALFLTPTVNYIRAWAKPQKGPFVAEVKVRCPEDGGVACYLQEDGHYGTGPFWRITDGHFRALDGNGSESGGTWVKVAPCEPDKWYTVRVTCDATKQKWTMAVDDTKGEKEFRFRFSPKALNQINFLVEGKESIYLDAIRILEPDAKK
ncbi:hypothetical protein GobsT_69710 [Gemmata obscuriglobus]|uniref:Serine/threonine protein kinase n=1 Tax=Gemmata obscuriglobus TaxID=114 RepID=A0A2Z3HFZ5_9BACT|nr:hypothetical protein [Gemmata obscuriglobus]AWM41905.1 hypothetical protein C1280_36205 [Gemmata obscuriglobus]QEG32120.1 hypothetical protein GobsT_69710 [Gemmata obscuriglobus]VTS11473.1 hypothetical protein : [Gemmata obscuriglobus UQM 2246]